MAEDVLALFEASVEDLSPEEPTVYVPERSPPRRLRSARRPARPSSFSLRPTTFEDDYTEVNLDLDGALEELVEEERPIPRRRPWSFSDFVVSNDGPIPLEFSSVGPQTKRERPPSGEPARAAEPAPSPRVEPARLTPPAESLWSDPPRLLAQDLTGPAAGWDPDDDLPEIDAAELIEVPRVDDLLCVPKEPMRVVLGTPVHPRIPKPRPRRSSSVLPNVRPRRTTPALLILAVTMLGAWAIIESAALRAWLPS